MKRNVPDLQEQIEDLRSESIGSMALLTGAIGYLWLVLVIWPPTGQEATLYVALAAVLLILGSTLGYVWRRRRLDIAALVLTGGVFLAIPCTMVAFRLPELAYLFVVPIVLASLLFGQVGSVAAAALAAAAVVVTDVHFLGLPLTSRLVWLPVGIIAVVSYSALLAASNLYTALEWMWSSYALARTNADLARDRQAELARTLKALDDASYRLERANEVLSRARDQADEARRIKQQFAQTISHELRTPLNLIVGFSQLMAQSPERYGSTLPAPYMRDLSVVYRNACHLQGLVNDVLDLARIEAMSMGLMVEEVRPEHLVREAVKTARSLVEARGLEMRTTIEPKLPTLWCDSTRIRQVLINLLNNAARYTESGSVSVSARRSDDSILFSVADTGIGIAANDLTRIFEDFEQADGTSRRRHDGAGLGLAISRRFVELHGGRIWVESQQGQGSTFSFTIPLSQPDVAADVTQKPSRHARSGATSVEPEHILLAVTHSPAAASLLTRYVRGYRTVVCRDLDQARRTAATTSPQVVVVDTTDQPMSATDVQDLARAWALPHTYVMAAPLPGEASLQQRLAVDGYIVKPVSLHTMWDTLRQFGETIERILLVDDDPEFLRLISRMLDSPLRRYRVTTAESGRQALDLIAHQLPDLALLDLGLPDMDGAEVVSRVRANPAWRSLPIVVVTARDEMMTIEAAAGPLIIARAEGLTPNDVVRLAQDLGGVSNSHATILT